MNDTPHWWSKTDESSSDPVLAGLRRHYKVIPGKPETLSARCFETFDWRLLREGLVLLECGKPRRLVLSRVEDRSTVAESRFTATPTRLFWQDLPEGALRERLRTICGVRALLAMGSFCDSRKPFDLLNADAKVVCRIALEEASSVGDSAQPQSTSGFRIMPLKGYEGEAARVASRMAKAGCLAEEAWAHPARLAFTASGREPFDYSSKTNLHLPSNVTTANACRRIHLNSLDVAERNLPGLITDLDTEFLHDFRVALRRSRSALQLVKGVYSPAVEKEFLKELAALQKATNHLRDLDVHLIEREKLEALLPPELQDGLKGLFRQITRERTQAFSACRKFLEAPSTSETLAKWRKFLEEDTNHTGPLAHKPAIKVGRRLLHKRFQRIIRDGRAIKTKSPDKALHDLRLQFKKLRYLLEFFGSLLPAGDTAFLIRRFRNLQNILGRFNDLSTQENWARRQFEAAESKKRMPVSLVASLGGLLSELARNRRAERAKFGKAFARLDTPEVHHKANLLFSTKKKAGK